MIGTSERARSSRQTAKPSMSGSRRSSSTRSGSAAASASAPVADALDLEALAAQSLGERLGDRVFVLDEQDVARSHRRTDARSAASVVYRIFAKPAADAWPDRLPGALLAWRP